MAGTRWCNVDQHQSTSTSTRVPAPAPPPSPAAAPGGGRVAIDQQGANQQGSREAPSLHWSSHSLTLLIVPTSRKQSQQPAESQPPGEKETKVDWKQFAFGRLAGSVEVQIPEWRWLDPVDSGDVCELDIPATVGRQPSSGTHQRHPVNHHHHHHHPVHHNNRHHRHHSGHRIPFELCRILHISCVSLAEILS